MLDSQMIRHRSNPPTSLLLWMLQILPCLALVELSIENFRLSLAICRILSGRLNKGPLKTCWVADWCFQQMPPQKHLLV
uniref:Uncharacterized protein n=1 Tax=Manihot esculenta TaxID=3983 RepID=A0A2C9W5T9_MANES